MSSADNGRHDERRDGLLDPVEAPDRLSADADDTEDRFYFDAITSTVDDPEVFQERVGADG